MRSGKSQYDRLVFAQNIVSKQMHPHFHYRCVLGCLGLQLTFKAEKVSATLIASYIPNNFLDNY